MTAVYAHRGASAEFPENTMAAFRRALELEVDGIELDVHLSADGIPVVIHDETVDRTTDGSGAVADLTVGDLQALDAGQGEPVPTLEQVLDLIGDKAHLDIEVKANEAGEAVVELLKGRNDTRWLISSFDWNVLRYVRSVDAEAELWPLTNGATDEAIDIAKALGSQALAINHRGLDEDIVAFLREQELGFWPWTVNDPARAMVLADWGAIGICTDDPATIQEAFETRTPKA